MIKEILKKLHLFNSIKYIYLFILKINDMLRSLLFPTAIILTYHRVAKTENDPWQLAVSPENFYDQLKYLKNNYQIISLEQLVFEIKNKTVKRGMLAITFDDGYADNLYNALQILGEFNIPATIFVSSGNMGKESFYWDAGEHNNYNRPLTIDELAEVNKRSSISIGGHTLSHPHIPTLNNEQKISEIVEDKKQLAVICQKEINLFSFPFGEYDQGSLKIVENAGYECACILSERRVSNRTSIYRLPRFLVRNWNSEEFIKNLKFKFL